MNRPEGLPNVDGRTESLASLNIIKLYLSVTAAPATAADLSRIQYDS